LAVAVATIKTTFHQNKKNKKPSKLQVPSDSFPISHHPVITSSEFFLAANISLLASIGIALING
jgi:hypothetical protein